VRPAPRFVVVCGDLIDAWPSSPDAQRRQIEALTLALSAVRVDVPLVCVCGNHDVGNRPTPASIQARSVGDSERCEGLSLPLNDGETVLKHHLFSPLEIKRISLDVKNSGLIMHGISFFSLLCLIGLSPFAASGATITLRSGSAASSVLRSTRVYTTRPTMRR
jgi:hypothetical protein